MVQTLVSKNLIAGEKIILFEKPRVLHRIFFSIRAMVDVGLSREMWLSFDDPDFHSHYVIDGSEKYFEARGIDIFQGNIWLMSNTTSPVIVAATEILH